MKTFEVVWINKFLAALCHTELGSGYGVVLNVNRKLIRLVFPPPPPSTVRMLAVPLRWSGAAFHCLGKRPPPCWIRFAFCYKNRFPLNHFS